MGNATSALRTEIHENESNVNILILGEQGDGKSALINSISFAITEKRSIIARIAVKQEDHQQDRGTTVFRSFRIGGDKQKSMGKVTLFDIPGMQFQTEKQRDLLSLVLAGIESHQEIPINNDEELAKWLPRASIENKNAIDFVIWAVDATKFESGRENGIFYSSASVCDHSRSYYEDLFKIIQQGSRSKYEPFLVFTKMDRTVLSGYDLRHKVFTWFQTNERWMIHNYTEDGQKRDSTDYTALNIVSNIIRIHQAIRKK
mmetsp:Transcript_23605/g.33026  ORF Transcript_23605/g.33026 Transcript_23605/m.33026 type:complete len:259 (+) Transcript_23605:29-805(+)|eukprot:CAMPEP_0168554806 /NCGR_PEP_ID=MMETSP0413-20121227/7984_1 /TAXON_ID=136452 /ORGANISM="Filamoeba nolandi, Strain NC-AS-23-1" /LENGTH=258 /DNA_ID=CAMNT_0008585587 /DNA_START=37 /DNA_END=813 /DNA_ORIENTATION=-